MSPGQRIRARILAVGLTQAELARRVGVAAPTISDLVRGDSRSSTHLHKIARELKTSPAYLNCETDDPSLDAADRVLSYEDRELLDLFQMLDAVDRKVLLKIIRALAGDGLSATVHASQAQFQR